VTRLPEPDPERAFADLARSFLERPGISEGKAFHATALKVEDKIFAMLVDGRLVVKLPVDRCVDLVAADHAVPFESGGRRMKEWVVIAPEEQERWPDYAEEALGFVRP
jgi:hypothetical protein